LLVQHKMTGCGAEHSFVVHPELSRLLSLAMRPRPPPAVVVMRRAPNGYNGLSFPNCYEVRTDDDGHLIRAAYV
jgi:hypothetical protein